MNILITGGSGFIGRYLIKNLLDYDLNIFAVYRELKKNFEFPSKINLINKGLEELVLKDLQNIEIIIHFASIGVSPKKASLKELERINVQESFRLMELAYEAGVRRFIVAGSCLEYGDEANNWDFIPPDALLRPICAYAKSKARAFKIMYDFAKIKKIEFFYGRIFSAYGEGQFKENFWPSLKYAAIKGKNFKMTRGDQIRDFIEVEKVANHFANATLRNDLDFFNPLIVNIGSGYGTKLKDFAIKEWKKFNASGRLIIGGVKCREYEISRMVANTEGLKLRNKY